MDVKELYNKLTPTQRRQFGVGSLNRKELIKEENRKKYSPFWVNSGTCCDCQGPTRIESGWGIACVNECWRLQEYRLSAEQKKYLEVALRIKTIYNRTRN